MAIQPRATVTVMLPAMATATATPQVMAMPPAMETLLATATATETLSREIACSAFDEILIPYSGRSRTLPRVTATMLLEMATATLQATAMAMEMPQAMEMRLEMATKQEMGMATGSWNTHDIACIRD